MATELNVSVTVDTESERMIYAYGGSAAGEMFILVVFRCPACGSTGRMTCALHGPNGRFRHIATDREEGDRG